MRRTRAPSFDELKARVTIMQVLLRYIEEDVLTDAGENEQLRMPCPLCEYEKKCLSVHAGKNVFRCFHCQAQGNILDFVAAAEETDIRSAAKLLGEWFPQVKISKQKKQSKKKVSGVAQAVETAAADEPLIEAVQYNKVLGFELKNIDPEHPDVLALGLPTNVIDDYSIGYYSGRGYLKDSLVAPVQRDNGDIIAYIGFDAERGVIYPPTDKFNLEADLFGLSAIPWGSLFQSVMYVVQNPIDVFYCAAHGVYAVATMSALPSLSDIESLASLTEEECDICYLLTERQDALETGKIVKRLVESAELSCRLGSFKKLLLS